MKKTIFCLLVVSLLSCNNKEKKAGTDIIVPAIDSLLITDSSWGLITPTADFELLKKLYGESNIKDERICGAECMDSVDVTKLYPGTTNEATIYWNETAYHKTISMIECFNDTAAWHTADGIELGSAFADLLKLNGQKITFSGFGWDYGGSISSYNGGKFENSNIIYRLDLSDYTGNDSILGDISIDSEMPAVQKTMDKIHIFWLTLSFSRVNDEH